MHHHNCFILSATARRLNELLGGDTLVKCFSNSIDEIYFEFENYAFRCIFHKGEMFFSFDNARIAESRLFRPQFRELIGLQVGGVTEHPYERSFHIAFANDLKLVFKCYGRKSNILLFNGDAVSDLFRKHIETDNELLWEQLFRNPVPVFEAGNLKNAGTFAKAYPALPPELNSQLGPDANEEHFLQMLDICQHIHALRYDAGSFELFPEELKENNITETLTHFTAAYLKEKIFSEQKQELLNRFGTQLKEKENYLKSNTAALEHLSQSRKDEEIGNIILANLHAIPGGVKKTMVNDVYHNVPIEIKLDDKLSAVQNAEAYFKKDKARPFVLQQLKQKIAKAVKEIETLKAQLAVVEKATRIKDLKAFIQEKRSNTDTGNLPYKQFSIAGYEVLVGKHAESNEKLLNYYSDKDDVWLHAKDVGGSHVIIKMKKQKLLPDGVLEKAASLAAWFSKARNQSLATVIYTPRKFVRKIKGGEKGQVTVSHEKSVLVKPGVNI